MLVLTRYIGQAILINLKDGTTIEVKILDLELTTNKCKQVKIGVDAPKDINIVRDELTRRPLNYEKIDRSFDCSVAIPE